MASTFALNKADLKSAFIAVAIAVGGGLYWMYRQKKAGASPNTYNAGLNNASASSGNAGAIAPSSTINTYNVFPTVSSQLGTPNAFYNAGHGLVSPNPLSNKVWLSNGQTFSVPVNT